MLEQLRKHACEALVEMARWKGRHHRPAYLLIGRVAGLSDERLSEALTTEEEGGRDPVPGERDEAVHAGVEPEADDGGGGAVTARARAAASDTGSVEAGRRVVQATLDEWGIPPGYYVYVETVKHYTRSALTLLVDQAGHGERDVHLREDSLCRFANSEFVFEAT